MKKIAILGCENSHADQFLGFIQNDPRYADAEVVGIYSEEADAAARLAEKYRVNLLDRPDAAVGQIDGLIVTARHGAKHFPFASPYIASGIPMFIDKPITVDEDDAVAFMRACRAAGVRLTGGSSCVHAEEVQRLRAAREQNEGGRTLGGIVRGPIDLESRYGGFWFYAQHVTEILCEIFGRYPTSILACERQDAITAVFRYPDYDATAFFADHSYVYAATRFSEEGNAGGVFPITGGSNCFRTEFDEFYRLLSGGEPRLPAEDLIAPVFAMSAIVRSLASGKEEPVHSFKI